MSRSGGARSVSGAVPGGPLDAGLQLERTSLSWRRTALSLAVGSLVSLRLLPLWLGSPVWVAPGIVGLLAASVLWAVSRRRHHAFMQRVRRGEEPRAGGAVA
ncbi:MAG TPA: DUF202 domain-containing protein, partial [Microbacterium sp.]|nr:DUF202 domain-containing protein [Microbacterium sp.]